MQSLEARSFSPERRLSLSVFLRIGKGKNKSWMYDFVQDGKRATKSGFKTKREAIAAEAERRKEKPTPEELTHQQKTLTDTTFLKMVNLRLDELHRYRSQGHYLDNVYMARKWVRDWGELLCSDISESMITDAVFNRKGTSPSTSNKELRYLKATFNFAIDKGFTTSNPVMKIKFLPVDRAKRYVPGVSDVLKVVAVADKDTQDYLWTIIGTLARVGEINKLQWDDINFDEGTITLYTRKKKNSDRTPRVINLPDWLYDILANRFNERDDNVPWVFCHQYWSKKENRWVIDRYKDRKRLMAGLCKKAGVKYFRFHALRHMGASVLEKNCSAAITEIQGILGHEKRTTTEIYLHAIGAGQKTAMKAFGEFWKDSHHCPITTQKINRLN